MSSSIHIGTQLIAPDGYLNLERGVTYYLLKHSKTGIVHLIDFVVRKPKPIKKRSGNKARWVNVQPTPLPHAVSMLRDEFEDGVLSGRIAIATAQLLLPPWLGELQGLNLAQVDAERPHAAKRHSERIDRALEVIYPLVQKSAEIIDSDDPELTINRYARSCKPRQNETRVRLAFYTYLLFGRNRFALHYPIHRIGHWCRATHESKIKRGRPSPRKGKGHGYNASPELIQQAVDWYGRKCGAGIDMATIYGSFMREKLGCRERVGRDNRMEFYHPDGRPFLTKGMFRYHIEQHLGAETVQRSLYGRVRFRSNIAPHEGSFTQNVSNLLERVERDAYSVEDLPRGLIDGHTLPPLHVVRSRDVGSGMLLGISFSQGAEYAEAYRMELFCRAICKVRFCRFFGLEITPEQWPSIGLSDHDVQDRGAGSTDGAFACDQQHQPVFRGIPPSRAAQSKAIIETSNPRTRKNDDAPSHHKSDKRVFELVRREIMRLLKDINSFNIGERIPADLLESVPIPSSLYLYRELDRRGRNDSLQITFEDAVRSFLAKRQATVTRAGIRLHNQLFWSKALVDSGLLSRASRKQHPHIEVYVLDGGSRCIWVDVDGQLIELDIQVPLRVGDESIYLSLRELEERERYIRERELKFDEHRDATRSATEREYENDTGKRWHGGATVAGRPKRGSKAAKKEAADAKQAMHARETA